MISLILVMFYVPIFCTLYTVNENQLIFLTLTLNAISSYGSNLFLSTNQCHCKPQAIQICPAGKWAMMLECELELHVLNKWLTAECTSLHREMRLTYVTMKLKVSLDNISKCFAMLHVFCIVVNCIFSCLLFFRILCIEMLHVYQRVESSHETRTGFFLFVSRIVVFLFFFCKAFILKRGFHN